MIAFIKKEFQAVFLFLARNKNETVVVGTTTLVLILERYHNILNEWFDSLLYFAVIPVIVIVILLRRNPLDYGFRIGNPRIWGFHVVLFCLIAYPILRITSGNPSLYAYYQKEQFSLISYFLVSFANLFASEFLFRGFLLFGLKEKFEEGSIFIQTIPFVLIHLGKPEPETISTIITGIYFGYICYRGKSLWPAFIVHMFINVVFLAMVNF